VKEIKMAELTIESIPREFEVTRQFESQQADEAELKSLRDKLFSTDTDADVKLVLGKSMEQLASFRIGFLRAFWARFGEFVQVVVYAQGGGGASTQPTGTITKAEVTKRYTTSPRPGMAFLAQQPSDDRED